ncbi:DUF2970 domain-containing protein [Aliidiomarina indica]|uniref:DUF2970 domain-containing protein n=1 Tax=Aliidiomarina indica TaxID=2749147 RepID=UPI0018906B62|nr:DUF2970 domain-containing protein [Aliidiomarina indica]
MSEQSERPGLFAIVVSVLAAMFGVQTEANRRRDFSAGNPLAYIIVFIIILAAFVLSVAGVVKLVMAITS